MDFIYKIHYGKKDMREKNIFVLEFRFITLRND